MGNTLQGAQGPHPARGLMDNVSEAGLLTLALLLSNIVGMTPVC